MTIYDMNQLDLDWTNFEEGEEVFIRMWGVTLPDIIAVRYLPSGQVVKAPLMFIARLYACQSLMPQMDGADQAVREMLAMTGDDDNE